MKTKIINLEITRVNKQVAIFNCDNKVSGVVHTQDSGSVTAILDGGYVMGDFHCPACFVDQIADLAIDIINAESKCGGDYAQHKTSFASNVFKTLH